MGSDFFIVPTSPDYYCKQAITSLARVLPRWNSGVEHFRNPSLLYPFPTAPPKFCGIISQRYRPRSGNPAKSFQQWIDQIKDSVIRNFVLVLKKVGMTCRVRQPIASMHCKKKTGLNFPLADLVRDVLGDSSMALSEL